MKKDKHYGEIPGTDKPTLFKPGAEIIGLMFRLAPSFERDLQWSGDHLIVTSECTLTHIPSGNILARAGGMCSTRETKYAFRQATRRCPHCNAAAINKGKKEFGGGWLCFKKKDGCGAKFDDKDPVITGQSGEREENPNLADVHNTVMKMADKRAYVAATLFGTAASEVFTQDIEDFPTDDSGPVPTPQPVAPPSSPSPTNEAETMLPEELNSRIHDMEYAFSHGTGEEWWEANYPEDIRPRCTPEQRQRITARKNELKGAGAPSVSQGDPPLSSGDQAGGASKPRGRPKKQAEPSETSQPNAEGEGRSAALLFMRQKMGEFFENTGNTESFYENFKHSIDKLSEGEVRWLQSEADALEGKQ